MSHGNKDRIERLKKRAAWLEDRMVDLPDDSFDRAEASALRWAIPILEAHIEEASDAS